MLVSALRREAAPQTLPDPALLPAPHYANHSGADTVPARVNQVASPHPNKHQAESRVPPRYNQILLVEDNVTNQKLASVLLHKRGYRVDVAANGVEALAMLEKSPYDLILMDIQMPEMNGLEATQAIRQREQQTNTHIPIIAMTASAMKGDRERCLAAGMDDYVVKPIQPDELYAAIDRVCLRANHAFARPIS
jgi:CheY-like chemotaxis protein